MPNSWTDWFANPWMGFWMNTVGLGLAVWSVVAATSAKRAANEAVKKLKIYDVGVSFVRMEEQMENLKSLLEDGRVSDAKRLSNVLRKACVSLKGDDRLKRILDNDTDIVDLIGFFGTLEHNITSPGFAWDLMAFNVHQDKITVVGQKVREENRNGST